METKGYPVRLYQEDDGSWAAEVPDLPGCVAAGDTPEMLVAMLADAIEEWIHSAEQEGVPVPEPSRPSSYSGRFVARVPPSLHEQLAWRAEQEGTSLNMLVVSALTAYVSRLAPDVVAIETPVRWRDVAWDFESGDVVVARYEGRDIRYGSMEWHQPTGEPHGGNVVDLPVSRAALVQ